MSEVAVPPELEKLLQEILANPNRLSYSAKYRILPQLDKLIQLQMRKLVTLQNLRDALSREIERRL